jgi:hypothetical protein
MDQWQRTCATRDSKRTKMGMLWYLASISGFAIIYGLMGMYDKAAILPSLPQTFVAQHSNGANPLTDFFLAVHLSHIPTYMTYMFALVAVALLAAAMSTANTFLIVCGHSFVSDLLIAVAKGSAMNQLSEDQEHAFDQDRAFVAIARASIIGMGVFVIVTWLLLSSAGLLSDPLSFFFIAYSIQFALLVPMVFARLPQSLWPSPKAVFHSIWLGALAALGGGLGFWMLVQAGADPILGVGVADWLALTPVITWLVGMSALILGLLYVPR